MAVLTRTVAAAVLDLDALTVNYLDVVAATARRDERAIPIQVLDLVIATPSDAIFALLEPGANRIVQVNSKNVADNLSTGSWMGQVDDVTRQTDGTTRVTVASADRRLLDWTPTAVDRTCWTMQDDVEKIWNYVLGRVFPGGYSRIYSNPIDVNVGGDGGPARVPVPFRTYRAVTNMLPDGGFEYGTAGYTAVNSTIGRSSSIKHGGTYALTMTGANGGGTPRAEVTTNLQPGQQYTMSGWFRLSAAMPTSGVSADARKLTVAASINGVQYTLFRSAQFNNDTTWTQFRFTFTMPPLADAGSVILRFVHGPTSSQSTVTSYWDDLLLVEGDGLDTDGVTPVPFFNGDTVDGTAGYNYDWQGDAGGSASTRTPVLQRDPDVLTWSPGQSAWDFLEPIMQTFGFRTVADPTWSPKAGTGPTVPGFSFVTSAYSGRQPSILYFSKGINLYGIDTGRSRTATFPDGMPLFADAVILRYSWTDAFGVEQVQYDTYALAAYSCPYYVELAQPFPGVGRAQSLYKRLVARRRTVTVTGRLNVTADPGTQVAITSRELGGAVFAYADTVEHDLIQGATTITTKAAIDYPTSAWLRLPAGESWNASPTGASWTAETIS